jgi:caffeoyl-CoA O-methyltransferase
MAGRDLGAPNVYADVDSYIAGLFAVEDEALMAAKRNAVAAGLPDIAVSPVLGKFLHVMARVCGARRILEIGTLAGYSAIWLARALPDDGRLITLESDAQHAAVARENLARAGLAHKVEVRQGPALETLPVIANERQDPFDLIFIDADKPPYPEYFSWALKLSRPGTLIIADNVIRDGRVVTQPGDEAVQGVMRMNATVAANPSVSACVLQTIGVKGHDGMTLAVVR